MKPLHPDAAADALRAKGIEYHDSKDIRPDEHPTAWIRRIMKGTKR